MPRYRCNQTWRVERHHFNPVVVVAFLSTCNCHATKIEIECRKFFFLVWAYLRLKPTHQHAKSKLANLCWPIERLNRTNTSHSFVPTLCHLPVFSGWCCQWTEFWCDFHVQPLGRSFMKSPRSSSNKNEWKTTTTTCRTFCILLMRMRLIPIFIDNLMQSS